MLESVSAPCNAHSPSVLDELLLGARNSDVENLVRPHDAGLQTAAQKSHFWPTVGRPLHLRSLVLHIDVIASITLNRVAGVPQYLKTIAMVDADITRFAFTNPDSKTVGAAQADINEMASLDLLEPFCRAAFRLQISQH